MSVSYNYWYAQANKNKSVLHNKHSKLKLSKFSSSPAHHDNAELYPDQHGIASKEAVCAANKKKTIICEAN